MTESAGNPNDERLRDEFGAQLVKMRGERSRRQMTANSAIGKETYRRLERGKRDANPPVSEYIEALCELFSDDVEGCAELKRLAKEMSGETRTPTSIYPANEHVHLKITDTSVSRERISLAPVRRQGGSTFTQDIVFDPPLALGEEVSVTIEAHLRKFHFLHRENVAKFNSSNPRRGGEFDFISRQLSFPIRHFRYSAFLPDELMCCDFGFEIVMDGQRRQRLEELYRASGAFSTLQTTDAADRPGTLLAFETIDPTIRMHVRLRWLGPMIREL